jgi:hypothetical protein
MKIHPVLITHRCINSKHPVVGTHQTQQSTLGKTPCSGNQPGTMHLATYSGQKTPMLTKTPCSFNTPCTVHPPTDKHPVVEKTRNNVHLDSV